MREKSISLSFFSYFILHKRATYQNPSSPVKLRLPVPPPFAFVDNLIHRVDAHTI